MSMNKRENRRVRRGLLHRGGDSHNILVDEKYLAEDGKPDIEKMQLITYDPVHHGYIELGKTVGKAFSDGKALNSITIYN